MELDEEQRVVKERLLSWPLSRLQSEVRARAACGPCPHLLLLLLTKELVPQACMHARTYVYVHTHEYACTQTQGMVLVEMGGKKQGAYFGKTVLVFSLARGGDLPFHKFRCVQVRVCSIFFCKAFTEGGVWPHAEFVQATACSLSPTPPSHAPSGWERRHPPPHLSTPSACRPASNLTHLSHAHALAHAPPPPPPHAPPSQLRRPGHHVPHQPPDGAPL